MSDKATDTELMAKIQRGEDKAFAELFDRHYRRVLNIVYRFLGRVSEAEDLAQEAFLRVHRAAPRYEPRAAFTTWLYQIVSRLCLNYRRDKARKKVLSFSGSPNNVETGTFDAVAEASAEEGRDTLIDEERALVVREGLSQLADNQRLALIFMHYNGLGYAEIAEALEITPGAAKALCHRARESLREKIQSKIKK